MKIQVDVTNKELDAMEDFLVAWNLCDKHNRQLNATEDQRWKYTQTCPNCLKINKEIRSKALRLWSKLVKEYEKAQNNNSKNKR